MANSANENLDMGCACRCASLQTSEEREREYEWGQRGRDMAGAELWGYVGADTLNSVSREGYDCGLSVLEADSVTVSGLVARANQSAGTASIHTEIEVVTMNKNV